MNNCVMKRRMELYEEYVKEVKSDLPHKNQITSAKEFENKYLTSPDVKWVDIYNKDREIVGFISLGIFPNCHPEAKCYLSDAYIKKEYRSKGYFSQVMKTVIRNHGGPYCMFVPKSNSKIQDILDSTFIGFGYEKVLLDGTINLPKCVSVFEIGYKIKNIYYN